MKIAAADDNKYPQPIARNPAIKSNSPKLNYIFNNNNFLINNLLATLSKFIYLKSF